MRIDQIISTAGTLILDPAGACDWLVRDAPNVLRSLAEFRRSSDQEGRFVLVSTAIVWGHTETELELEQDDMGFVTKLRFIPPGRRRVASGCAFALGQ